MASISRKDFKKVLQHIKDKFLQCKVQGSELIFPLYTLDSQPIFGRRFILKTPHGVLLPLSWWQRYRLIRVIKKELERLTKKHLTAYIQAYDKQESGVK